MNASFDPYQSGLIRLAAAADNLTVTKQGDSVKWADSFTHETLHVLTGGDASILEWGGIELTDEEEGAAMADTVREGIIERIVDDVACALPDGSTVEWDDGVPFIMQIIRGDQIQPGDIYQGREVFSVLSRPADATVRIVVVCPANLPPIGEHGTGKFTFGAGELVPIRKGGSAHV